MDDLESRLDELSRAGEPRGADAIWHAARRKLRRRRIVRAGALATTAVLLIAVIGVVVNDNRRDNASMSDSTTTTATPKPIGTEGRLAATIVLPSGRLDPPEPSDLPTITAFEALRPTTPRADLPRMDLVNTQDVAPAVRLARCTGCAHPPLTSPLVWAVIFYDIVSAPPVGPTGGTLPPARPSAMIWFVDALTGAGGEGLGPGVRVTAAQLACQGGCTPLVPPTTSNEPADVVLRTWGACGDAFFWAANADETVAVTVTVEARERSATEPTVIDFALPDPKVQVEVQRGRGLVQPFCNDVIDGNAWKLDSREGAAEAAGRITLAPDTGGFECAGQVKGTLHLDNLVAKDGTRISAPTMVVQSIGCYAG